MVGSRNENVAWLYLVVEVRLGNPRLTGDMGTELPSLSSETAHRLSLLQSGGGLQVAQAEEEKS